MTESMIHKNLLTKTRLFFKDNGYDVIDRPRFFHHNIDGSKFGSNGTIRPDLLIVKNDVASFVEVFHNKVGCDLYAQIERYSLHCKNIFIVFSNLHTADKIKKWLSGIIEDNDDVNIFLLSEGELKSRR